MCEGVCVVCVQVGRLKEKVARERNENEEMQIWAKDTYIHT